MSRRGLAAAVLGLWLVVLGWHVKREYLRPAVEVLAEAARGLPPGDAYYAVFQGERRIGWARSQVDTLPESAGFRLLELIELHSVPGSEARLLLETEVELSAALTLRRFAARASGRIPEGARSGAAPGDEAAAPGAGGLGGLAAGALGGGGPGAGGGAPGEFAAEGEVRGDSLLLARLRTGPGAWDSVRVALSAPLVPTAAWPLRAVASGRLRAGDRLRIELFDPLALGTRRAELRVVERSLRSYPDSAVRADGGDWRPARADTLEAWLLEHDLAGMPLRAWVGRDGRLLEARLPGGIRLERTAFELAFFGRDANAADGGGPGEAKPDRGRSDEAAPDEAAPDGAMPDGATP